MYNWNKMANEMLRKFDWELIVHYMDDEVREALHECLSPCSEIKFLTAYLEHYHTRYGEFFEIN